MQFITPDKNRQFYPTEADQTLADLIIKTVLKEDIRTGDITTNAVIRPRQKAHAVIITKSAGILAGIHFCAQTFSIVNENVSMFFPVSQALPKMIFCKERILKFSIPAKPCPD